MKELTACLATALQDAVGALKVRIVIIACLAAAVPLPLQALDNATAQSGLPSAADYSARLLPETDGVVSWRTLADMEYVSADGGKVVPKFSKPILDLDNKEVRIHGFMLPLNVGFKQGRFLVSAVPPDCGFCMPAGAEGVVEVLSNKPIPYATDPILVKGKLAVLKSDARGVLYQLTDATTVAGVIPGR